MLRARLEQRRDMEIERPQPDLLSAEDIAVGLVQCGDLGGHHPPSRPAGYLISLMMLNMGR